MDERKRLRLEELLRKISIQPPKHDINSEKRQYLQILDTIKIDDIVMYARYLEKYQRMEDLIRIGNYDEEQCA